MGMQKKNTQMPINEGSQICIKKNDIFNLAWYRN